MKAIQAHLPILYPLDTQSSFNASELEKDHLETLLNDLNAKIIEGRGTYTNEQTLNGIVLRLGIILDLS
jgi:hypothetical protein